jgi:Acetyltransferase (GNAT) domain
MSRKTKWEFAPAIECFEQMSADWDALNRARGNHVLLDSKFVGALVRHFATPDVLLAIRNDSTRPGMALVQRHRPGFWQIFTPEQAPLGPILLTGNDSDGEIARELMTSLAGYPMQLAILAQDPEHSAWFPAGEDSHLERFEFFKTGRILLEGTFEDYWAGRDSNLKKNLARRRRRLSELGHMELVVHRNEEAMAACIREFGMLESSGWKGLEGSAVNENNIQGRFYRDMFERFCATGETLLFHFLLDGKVIAVDLCLLRGDMMVALKTSFDETLKALSAPIVMREDIIRLLYREGQCKKIEFYGRVLEWQTKWISNTRSMYHINCHRNAVVSGIRSLVRSMR